MRSLLLLVIALSVLACGRQQKEISIKWENNKAVAVTVPVADSISVYVEGSEFNLLGVIDVEGDQLSFTPAVPFERGQTYTIKSKNSILYSFSVPPDTTAIAPRLLGSYPSCDTVPENLLKIYLQFDQPMVEGRSADHVVLIEATTNDTVRGAFLDLQPELWNEDQSVLTLWLDPGRIKKDLIPNKTLGEVLSKDRTYRLVVARGWKSKNGLNLDSDHVRTFLTRKRDVQKPDVATWNIKALPSDVVVSVNEALDWSLLNSTLAIRKGNEKIALKISTNECEHQVHLTPIEPLAAGNYTIEIESRLEDLAGNNLNRLFETDVTEGDQRSNEKLVHTLTFTVR